MVGGSPITLSVCVARDDVATGSSGVVTDWEMVAAGRCYGELADFVEPPACPVVSGAASGQVSSGLSGRSDGHDVAGLTTGFAPDDGPTVSPLSFKDRGLSLTASVSLPSMLLSGLHGGVAVGNIFLGG